MDKNGKVNETVQNIDESAVVAAMEQEFLKDESESVAEVQNNEPQEEISGESDEIQEEAPKKSRAQERITKLIDENKELKSKLDEVLTLVKQNNTPAPTPKKESMSKEAFLKKVTSQNVDEFYQAMEDFTSSKAEAIANQRIQEIVPILRDLAIEKKTREDGLDNKELQKVFTEFPELLNSPNGYKIAQKMLKTNNGENIGKDSSVGMKGKSVNNKTGNKNLTEKEIQAKLLEFFSKK